MIAHSSVISIDYYHGRDQRTFSIWIEVGPFLAERGLVIALSVLGRNGCGEGPGLTVDDFRQNLYRQLIHGEGSTASRAV